MPIEDHQLPWWLGPSKAPWEAMIAGIQAGSTIRANQIATSEVINRGAALAQQTARDETATKLKLLDLSLEAQRNDIALQAFNLKQTSQIQQKQAMLEVGQYVADATANDKLTDPATHAGFISLASKWAPYLDELTIKRIEDNSFIKAQELKNRIETGEHIPAPIYESKVTRDMLAQADLLEEEDPKAAKDLREEVERIRNASRLTLRQTGPPEVGSFVTPSGQSVDYYLNSKGEIKTIKPPKEGLSEIDRRDYAARLRALNFKLEKSAFDPEEKLTKTESDNVTFERQLKQLNDEFSRKVTRPGITTPPTGASQPTNSPSWDDFLNFKTGRTP